MSQHSTHRTVFQDYIRAGVQASLARVQAAEHIVPELDRQQAWHMLSFALDVPEVWDVTCALLLALAPKMEQAGFRQAWMVYLVEAHKQSKNWNDWQAAAEFELQIGLLHRLLSHFDEARQWTSASVEHFAALGFSEGEARALNELAWVENLLQHHSIASQYARQALALVNEPLVNAMSYRVLGMIAQDQANWNDAEIFHHQSLALFKKLNHKRFIAWGMQNLAIALNWQGKFQEAIKLYRQAAKILAVLSDKQHEAIVLMNLALTYQNNRQFARALISGIQAKAILEKLGDKLNLARVETNLGLVYYRLLKFEQAINSFRISSQYHADLGNKHLALNALDGLAMSLIALKQYEDAINILTQALNELPTIFNKPNHSYLLESMTKHLDEAEAGRGIHMPLVRPSISN